MKIDFQKYQMEFIIENFAEKIVITTERIITKNSTTPKSFATMLKRKLL